jgi:pimeloyl-ACP methyl ester carboxylesterase
VLAAAGGWWAWREYRALTAVPASRLRAGGHYPEMPPDGHHHYLELPIDHGNPSRGTFTGFYILSPNFKPGGPVVFWLFDGQQERVGLMTAADDFDYFENSIGGLSYVLIGNRGRAPTLFPEVYGDGGEPNYAQAMKLYGSAQQLDDIEAVRRDMQSKGLLPPDGTIMLYGGSGGGFLVQQYLDKYGSHVSRALIESSGAPDLAQANHVSFARPFYDSNAKAAAAYFSAAGREGTRPSLAYVLFRLGLKGDTDSQTRIAEGQMRYFSFSGEYAYLTNWLKPAYNFPLISFLLGVPSELEVRVRMYELLAPDLQAYRPELPQQIVLMYEWTKLVLEDFLQANARGTIATPRFALDRSRYDGEVLVWASTGDQDFSSEVGKWIAESYPHSRIAIFADSHERARYPDYYLQFRKAFFTAGLDAQVTQTYFRDMRQLNGKAR